MSSKKGPVDQTDKSTSNRSSYNVSTDSSTLVDGVSEADIFSKSWKSKHDEELHILTWLQWSLCSAPFTEHTNAQCVVCRIIQKHGSLTVLTLWCSVRRAYKSSVCGMQNYLEAWIASSEDQRASNVIDHGNPEEHKAAMCWHRQAQVNSSSQPVTSYAPIANSLLNLGKNKLKREFVYAIDGGMSFEKFADICELEQRLTRKLLLQTFKLGTYIIWLPDPVCTQCTTTICI